MKTKVRGTMAVIFEMTVDEVYEYLRKIQSLHEKADNKKKGLCLSEMVSRTGGNRYY